MDASLRTRVEELPKEIAHQAKTAEDLNELLRLMMKSGIERMLNTEMDVHLGRVFAAGVIQPTPRFLGILRRFAWRVWKELPARAFLERLTSLGELAPRFC